MESSDLFAQYLSEAPDDQPPDVGLADDAGESPPDIPDDPPPADDGPPDMGDGGIDDGGDDGAPPEMEDDGFGDMGDDEGFGDEENTDGEDGNNGPPELDEKVSAILNNDLYQRFLGLLNTIGSQIVMIRDNSDILLSLSKDSLKVSNQLKRLDKNIRLYLKNTFIHENYSKNLLFFNKCLNLLKLLDDLFNKDISKGIKDSE